jgi:hypothetical protein
MKKYNTFFLLLILFLPTILLTAPLMVDNDSKGSIDITIEVSALPTHVVINEVLFDDVQAQDDGEFIELYNPTSSTIDISGYKITDEESDGGEGVFEFPNGSVIASRGFFVIFKSIDPANLITPEDVSNDTQVQLWETCSSGSAKNDIRVPDVLWITGSTDLDLANAGDEVFLKDSSDVVVDSVGYGDPPSGYGLAQLTTSGCGSGGWEGYSFERNWTSSSANWEVSSGEAVKNTPSPGKLQGDTPEFGGEDPFGGGIPSTPVINEVYFGEIFDVGNTQINQYIEIFNPTDKNWNLTGWEIETKGGSWVFNKSKWADELGDSDILLIWPDNNQSVVEDDQWPWGPTDDEAPWWEFWNNVDDMETWYPSDDFTHPESDDYTNHALIGADGDGVLNLDMDGDYVVMRNTSGDVIDAVAWGSGYSLPSDAAAVIGDQDVGSNHGISRNESLERIWQKHFPVCAFLAGPGVFHEPTPGWKVGSVPDEIVEQTDFDTTIATGNSIDVGSLNDGIEIDGPTATETVTIHCEKLEKNPKDHVDPNGVPSWVATTSGVDTEGLEFWHIQANGTSADIGPLTITIHFNGYYVAENNTKMFTWDHTNNEWDDMSGTITNGTISQKISGVDTIDISESNQLWIGVWGEVTAGGDGIPGFEWLFSLIAIISIGYLWLTYKKRRL